MGITYLITKRKYKFKGETEFNEMITDLLNESIANKSMKDTATKIADILKEYYNVEYISILMNKGVKYTKLSLVETNINPKYTEEIERYCSMVISGTIVKLSISDGGNLEYPTAQERGVKFSLIAPLIYGDNMIGAILLEGKSLASIERGKFREEIYSKIFKSTALVLQNVIYTEKVVRMLSTDQLTGVYNRRYIDNKLREEIRYHRDNNKQFNLVMLDIDYFKKFNDTYGHQFGDIVLREMAQYIKRNIRGEDISIRRVDWVARYGGEEFMVVFSDSDRLGIYKKVDKLRKGLSELVIENGEFKANITVSFGISTFPLNGEKVESLIEKADMALYKSKKDGRNKVTLYEGVKKCTK